MIDQRRHVGGVGDAVRLAGEQCRELLGEIAIEVRLLTVSIPGTSLFGGFASLFGQFNSQFGRLGNLLDGFLK